MRKIHLDTITSPPFRPDEVTARPPLIVVIDDSPTIRKIVETCLGREGFEVKSFPDGVEALMWLVSPAPRLPDLVLLDIGLPKMDGYEVARRLKANPQYHQILIILLSRRESVVDRLKGRLVGAKAFISKPITTQRLLALVEMYLGKACS